MVDWLSCITSGKVDDEKKSSEAKNKEHGIGASDPSVNSPALPRTEPRVDPILRTPTVRSPMDAPGPEVLLGGGQVFKQKTWLRSAARRGLKKHPHPSKDGLIFSASKSPIALVLVFQ